MSRALLSRICRLLIAFPFQISIPLVARLEAAADYREALVEALQRMGTRDVAEALRREFKVRHRLLRE